MTIGNINISLDFFFTPSFKKVNYKTFIRVSGNILLIHAYDAFVFLIQWEIYRNIFCTLVLSQIQKILSFDSFFDRKMHRQNDERTKLYLGQ